MAISRISGVPLANIAKVNGVAIANVEKISGVEKEAGVGPSVIIEDHFDGTAGTVNLGRTPAPTDYLGGVYGQLSTEGSRAQLSGDGRLNVAQTFRNSAKLDLSSADFVATLDFETNENGSWAILYPRGTATNFNGSWRVAAIRNSNLYIYEGATNRASVGIGNYTSGKLTCDCNGDTIIGEWTNGGAPVQVQYDLASMNNGVANCGIGSWPGGADEYIDNYKVVEQP